MLTFQVNFVSFVFGTVSSPVRSIRGCSAHVAARVFPSDRWLCEYGGASRYIRATRIIRVLQVTSKHFLRDTRKHRDTSARPSSIFPLDAVVLTVPRFMYLFPSLSLSVAIALFLSSN